MLKLPLLTAEIEGMFEAIWPVAIHMPVGGFDSVKVFEALRRRPWKVELFDGPRLRFGSVVILC